MFYKYRIGDRTVGDGRSALFLGIESPSHRRKGLDKGFHFHPLVSQSGHVQLQKVTELEAVRGQEEGLVASLKQMVLTCPAKQNPFQKPLLAVVAFHDP